MSTLRQRFPKRIGAPPSRVTGDTATFLRQVSDALNAFPQFSVFSYLTPESNVTAAPVTLGINYADSSATQIWFKTTGYGNTGWTALSQINVPTAHVLATTAALGPEHTVSGLTARQVLIATGATTALFRALVAADLPTAALTKVDDTNVTVTLGGSPTTALLNAASLTLGWTGTLAAARLNANVVQAITNDTNVTGSIAAQNLTLGWTGTLAIARGGTGQATAVAAFDALAPTTTLGDVVYHNGTDNVRLAGNITTAKQYLSQTGTGTVSAAPAWATIAGADIMGAALTKGDDTNVTLTLGGTPTTALLRAASITLGWTGLLGLARGGTAADLSATGGASQVLRQSSAGAVITVGQLGFSDISGVITYAQLPTGSGSWDSGVDTTITITRALTVSGLLTANSKARVIGNDDTLTLQASGVGAAQYQEWESSALVRRGYFGFDVASDDTITLANATAAGTFRIVTESTVRATFGSTITLTPATTVSGLLTASAGLTLTGTLTMATAISKIVPGATSWGVRNNADTADNIIITDVGAATFRGAVDVNATVTANSLIVEQSITLSSAFGANIDATIGNLFLQRASVTKITISTSDVTFADSIKVASFLSTASAADLLLQRNGVTGLTLGSDGRVWASGIHNSAGAMTGTTNQYIGSGTYTPTLTNVTNVDASTAYACQWTRVGNVVTVSGKVDIDPTAVAATSLGISLPIASALVNQEDCAGTASASGVQSQVAAIIADTVNDRAQMTFIPVNTTNQAMYFNFSYEVL